MAYLTPLDPLPGDHGSFTPSTPVEPGTEFIAESEWRRLGKLSRHVPPELVRNATTGSPYVIKAGRTATMLSDTLPTIDARKEREAKRRARARGAGVAARWLESLGRPQPVVLRARRTAPRARTRRAHRSVATARAGPTSDGDDPPEPPPSRSRAALRPARPGQRAPASERGPWLHAG